MKLFVMLFVSFTAASAMACPNLDGVYQCEKDQNDPADSGIIQVQTAQHEGSTIYVVVDNEDQENPSYLPADGKTYQEGSNTYVGTCAGNTFNMTVTGVDQTVGPFTMKSTYALDSARNLANQGTVSFKYQGQDYNEAFGSTCARLQ